MRVFTINWKLVWDKKKITINIYNSFVNAFRKIIIVYFFSEFRLNCGEYRASTIFIHTQTHTNLSHSLTRTNETIWGKIRQNSEY